jgi:hypothetical protein
MAGELLLSPKLEGRGLRHMTIEEGNALQVGDPVWSWHGYEWLPSRVRGLRFGRMLHVDLIIESELRLSGKFRKKTPRKIERRNPDLQGADRPRHSSGRSRIGESRRHHDSAGSFSNDG